MPVGAALVRHHSLVTSGRRVTTYPASRAAKVTVLLIFSGPGLFMAGWSLVEGLRDGIPEAAVFVAFGVLLAAWGFDLAGYRVEMDAVRVVRRTTFRRQEVAVRSVVRASVERGGARSAPQVHLYDGDKTLKVTSAFWEPADVERFVDHVRELFALVWVDNVPGGD